MAGVLERGDISFFYQPRPGAQAVRGPQEVERLYLILSGDREFGRRCRLLAFDDPVLPVIGSGEPGRRAIARVAAESDRPEDMEKALSARRAREAQGERGPGPVERPAGEGRYAFVEHDGHTDLTYVLELPATSGPVQRDLGIGREGSYRLVPRGVGEAGRALDPATLREGVELALEAEATTIAREVRAELNVQPEVGGTAEIFAELKLPKTEYPTEPLYRGEWR